LRNLPWPSPTKGEEKDRKSTPTLLWKRREKQSILTFLYKRKELKENSPLLERGVRGDLGSPLDKGEVEGIW